MVSVVRAVRRGRTHLVQDTDELLLADLAPELTTLRHPEQQLLDALGAFWSHERYPAHCRRQNTQRKLAARDCASRARDHEILEPGA